MDHFSKNAEAEPSKLLEVHFNQQHTEFKNLKAFFVFWSTDGFSPGYVELVGWMHESMDEHNDDQQSTMIVLKNQWIPSSFLVNAAQIHNQLHCSSNCCFYPQTHLSRDGSPGPEYRSPVSLSRDACLGRSPPWGLLLSEDGLKSPGAPWWGYRAGSCSLAFFPCGPPSNTPRTWPGPEL